MTTTFTEGLHATEFILYDEDSYSRDQETLAAAAGAVVPGTLLGKITATGKVVPYSNAAADGSQTAIGIAIYPAEDLAVDQKITVLKRSSEVTGSLLTGLDAPGTADLAAAGIIVR
jgi:hypothetical protein